MPQKGKHRPPHRREKKQHTRVPVQNTQTATKTTEAPHAAAVPKASPAAKVTGRTGYTGQTSASLTKARYPYLISEMKWIGIVAATIIILLIILAVVIPPRFA